MPNLSMKPQGRELLFFMKKSRVTVRRGKPSSLAIKELRITKRHSAIFGKHAVRQFVFDAGFPSAGKQEFEAVRQVVGEVDCCYLCISGRATREEADLLLRSSEGARYGRISIALPVSSEMSFTMLHKTPAECLSDALNIASYILNSNTDSRLDFALVDATRADIGFVADAAMALTRAGASMMIACDTVGAAYPNRGPRLLFRVERPYGGVCQPRRAYAQ